MKDFVRVFSILTFLLSTPCLLAQDKEITDFVQNQFYGNRVKLGSIITTADFQRTGYEDPDREGITGRIGVGLGIGLSENVVFSVGYQRDRVREVIASDFPLPGQSSFVTANTFQLGFRFLPNTIGGFIQPYLGADFFRSDIDYQTGRSADPFLEEAIGGVRIPVGVIFWISNFMSVNLQPLEMSLTGNFGSDVEYNGVFNADLKLLNPSFGLSFLINGKKP